MSRIRVLPQEIANQIAAGEVVERPASVVKELVENAIDAGSARITVEVELGGRRLIKVSDDGAGIGPRDAKLAFIRHATSKLNTLNDLEAINTLGFRGEALASISSVARVILTTKTGGEEYATRIEAGEKGEFQLSETARPRGTTVEVRDLFFNTPARRKFLKSQPTENFHIAAIVTHYALANPDIAFSLTNNGRESLRATPAKTLRERAYQLFGKELIESLIPVSGENEGFVRVTGFVSAPRERRTNRDSQYLFINGRFVKDRVVSSGISEAYRSVLPHGVHPVAFLFLDMPTAEVDVNVHPSKTEVRFRRAEAVKEVVARAVREALSGAGIGNAPHRGKGTDEAADKGSDAPADATGEEYPMSRAASVNSPANELRGAAQTGTPRMRYAPSRDSGQASEIPAESLPTGKTKATGPVDLPPVDSAYSVPSETGTADLDPGTIKIVGQLHNSFIIASDDEGLLLIDQHVAHERILFDKYREKEKKRPIASQNLLIPETMDLTPAQVERFTEIMPLLQSFGFSATLLSGRTIALKSAPSDLPSGEIRNLVSELLETVETENLKNAESAIRDHIAATLACKAAVKINTGLTAEKMRWMVDRLLLTDSPTTCPHGRPVVLRLTMKDIERKFHRT